MKKKSLPSIKKTHSLNLEDNLIIIAGGDIHIFEINSSQSKRITLISTTGSTIIENIKGAPQILALAWQGTHLPYGALSQSVKLEPDIKQAHVLGISMSANATASQ